MTNKTTIIQLIIGVSSAVFASDYVVAQGKRSVKEKSIKEIPRLSSPESQERGSLIAKEKKTLARFEFVKSKEAMTGPFLEEFKKFDVEITNVEAIEILSTATKYYLAAYSNKNSSLFAEMVKISEELYVSPTITELIKCQGNPCDKCKLDTVTLQCVCKGAGTLCDQSTQSALQFKNNIKKN